LNIRALIIEDEPLARRTLRDFAAEFDWLEIVGESADGVSAVNLIDALTPALVFLDVRIPELSGIEVLRQAQHKPAIVFTTAFDDYAITAFEFEALDYLQKPFGRARFRQTIERVRRRLLSSERREITGNAVSSVSTNDTASQLERIFVRVGNKIVPVPVADVIRLVAEDDYTRIYAGGKSYLVNTTLSEFVEQLPVKQFCRVHRSAIVNLEHIRLLKPHDRRLLLQMSDGAEIIASRAGSQLLRNSIY